MSGNRTTIERPLGSLGAELQQQAVTNYLLVTAPPGAPLPVDIKMYLNAACGPLNPIDVEDTGLNTNPARWLQIYHWECNQVTVAAAGVGGQQNLGAVVGAGLRRRIREITIRHAGSNNTVVTILIAGGATKVTIDVPAQTTRMWSSEDGIAFAATEQPACQTSDVTGGSSFVSARGVEAAPT